MRDTDPDAWVGWTTDPALTTRFCAWIRLGSRWRLYVWPWRVMLNRELAP